MTSETEIRPFRIDIPRDTLDDLAERLGRTRWAPQLPGVRWTRGVPVDYLRDLADYWRSGYDWRKNESELNAIRSSRPRSTVRPCTSCTYGRRSRMHCRSS